MIQLLKEAIKVTEFKVIALREKETDFEEQGQQIIDAGQHKKYRICVLLLLV